MESVPAKDVPALAMHRLLTPRTLHEAQTERQSLPISARQRQVLSGRTKTDVACIWALIRRRDRKPDPPAATQTARRHALPVGFGQARRLPLNSRVSADTAEVDNGSAVARSGSSSPRRGLDKVLRPRLLISKPAVAL